MCSGLVFFIELSILSVGVRESFGRTYQGRTGYDLSNGPVTYEAYYPDAQVDDHVVEKSYQRNYGNPDHNQLSEDTTPFGDSPQAYVNQYRREQPNTELEDALKMLIDVIRDERIPPRNIEDFYIKKPSKIDDFYVRKPQNFDDFYLKKPINLQKTENYEQIGLENIFKPRPQVLNYVFSKGEGHGKALIGPDDQGMLQGDEGKKEDVPQVASIQVSEKPHKIRHHHGENLRRTRIPEN